MSRPQEDLVESFFYKKLSRREFLARMARLGISGAAAGFMLNAVATRALAQAQFDWKKYSGQTIKLLLNKHPYTDALLANLGNFKSLTGMDVDYDIYPEDVYVDRVVAALFNQSSELDVFMITPYQTWQSGPAGWLVDLNEFIHDPAMTADSYRWDDILANLRQSTAWSGVPGDPLGGANARQWAVPWGFELYNISYNQRILDLLNMDPPQDLPDLIEKAVRISKDVQGVYGIGVRGTRNWATIPIGYLSGLVNYGGTDFTVQSGNLRAAMNSPQAKQFTALWIDMIRKGGPPNWPSYDWYKVGNDLGAGAAAMIYDADIVGYFQQTDTKEAGHIAYAPFAPNPEATAPTPNVSIWSFGMSAFSQNRPAGWYFIQWATGTEHTTFGALQADLVDPVRQSVWDNNAFQERLEQSYPGYLSQYQSSIDRAKIYFTPQPLFFNLTTEWAAVLQRMYAYEIPVDEGLDQLAEFIDRQLRNAGITR